MEILKELGATIAKMFIADLGLSIAALAVVLICGFGLKAHMLSPPVVMFLLPLGVLAALLVGVVRGLKL